MHPVDSRRRRIVLVDQTGVLERHVGDALVAAGFDVTTVDSAGRCLDIVEGGDVDGIVSAYALPDIDGVSLARSVRVSHPTLPFVLTPDDGTETVAGDAVDARVSGYVPAGADAGTVVSRLRESFERDGPWVDDESHRRYRHLIERSPAPINLFDEHGVSIWGNDAVVDLLGLDGRDDLVGHSVFEFIHPDDHDRARREVGDVIDRKADVGPTRMRLRRPDGSVRHVQVSTATGRFLGADIGQAVVIDVTQLRAARNALRAERQFVEGALDELEDVFYVVDPAGTFERWNGRLRAVTGYTDAELARRTLGDLIDPEDVGRVAASIRRTLDVGEDVVGAGVRTAPGRTVPYEFRNRRLVTPDGDVTVVGIGRDVSKRRERERQLKVLERWLRHNIRNGMNVIQGVAEGIERGEVEDVAGSASRIRRKVDHLVEQAERQRTLVDLLTDPPDPVPVDARRVVERQVRRSRETYPDATIELVRADDVRVRAVPRLEAAIGELVENAVEHSDAATPRVGVELWDGNDGWAYIRISDNGPGIPERERELLFLEREVDPLNHSSGIGLLLVYWVAHISGGTVTFDGDEPRGGVVTLWLPTAGAGGG